LKRCSIYRGGGGISPRVERFVGKPRLLPLEKAKKKRVRSSGEKREQPARMRNGTDEEKESSPKGEGTLSCKEGLRPEDEKKNRTPHSRIPYGRGRIKVSFIPKKGGAR